MFFFLAFLQIHNAQATYNLAACQAAEGEMHLDCMTRSCSGLLTTGNTGFKVRDDKECESECQALAHRRIQNEEVCIPPLPVANPNKAKAQGPAAQNDNFSSQKTSQKNALEKTSEAESTLQAKKATSAEASQFGQKLQDKKIQSSDELLRQWDKELSTGKSRVFPADRNKWKNDAALVREAERARQTQQRFPPEKANRAQLPAIRGNLNQFSQARDLESDSVKNLSALAAALAQLAQMKAATQANVAALEQTSLSPVFLRSPPLSEINSPSASSEKSGQKTRATSAIAEQEEKSAQPSGNPEANEALPQAEAGAGRASPASLRARLRDLLRKKMAEEGTTDLPEEFLGELGLSGDANPVGVSAEQAAALAAEEEIFRLAGNDTDAEIRQLRAELQEELARSEGVLPSESLNLFERVKHAYQACLARQCVLPHEQIAGRF